MTPKSKLPRKLSLNRETLKKLRAEDLEKAAGAYTYGCTWMKSCNMCLTQDCDSYGHATCFTVCPCTIA